MDSLSSSDVVIIARVSTTEQNAETQLHECNEFCEEKNLNAIETVDIAESAYKTIPKQLRDIVNRIENGELKVGALVFTDVDRFSRKVLHGLHIIETLKNNNVKLLFVREPMLDMSTPDGMCLMRHKLSQAELEADKISQRVKHALTIKKFLGHHVGVVPFGKMCIKNKLYDNPQELMIINIIGKLCSHNTSVCEILYNICQYHRTYKTDNVENEYILHNNGIKMDPSETLRITIPNIALLLNQYNITKRNKEWNASMIHNICKQHKFNKPGASYKIRYESSDESCDESYDESYDDKPCKKKNRTYWNGFAQTGI